MKKNRRAQTQKPRNQQFNAAMREIASSSTAEPHRNKARYSRSDRRDRSWREGY